MSTTDLYATLQLSRSASEADIRRAYKKLALKYHPDKNPDGRDVAGKRFKAVSLAYEVLSNAEKRRLYDAGGMAAVEQGEAPSAANGPRDEYGRPDVPAGGGGSGHEWSRQPQRASAHGSGPYHAFPAHFMPSSPFAIFEAFFGTNDPFAEMERQSGIGGFFGGGMGGGMGDPFAEMDAHMRAMQSQTMQGSSAGGRSVHSQRAGGTGCASMMSFSSSSFGAGPGTTSISQRTEIVNGRGVTKTVRRTVDANGQVHEAVEEQPVELGRMGGFAPSITSGGH